MPRVDLQAVSPHDAHNFVVGPAPRADEISRMMHRSHVRPPSRDSPPAGVPLAKPRPGPPEARFLCSVCGGASLPIFPPSEPRRLAEHVVNRDHHSNDPYGQDRKQQNIAQERRHIAPPLYLPCACPSCHSKVLAWSHTRHTNRHKLFHACFPHPAEVRQNALAFPHGIGGEAIARSHHSRMIASHEPEAVHPCRYRHEPETGDPCRYRGRAAGRFGAVASAGASALRRRMSPVLFSSAMAGKERASQGSLFPGSFAGIDHQPAISNLFE